MPDVNQLDTELTGTFRLPVLTPSVVPAINAAREVLDDALQTIAATVQAARRYGKLNVRPVLGCATRIVAEVTQRPDLMLWLIRADQRGGYLYRRAVGSAVIGVAFGRHLGLNPGTLEAIASGMLLLDIGKVAVPVTILAKPDALGVVEHSFVRRHVERGLDLVTQSGPVSPRAIEMLLGHHERIDGSGYPEHLMGTRIPLYARLAAIVDTFDALTLNRRYAAAMSPHAALRFLDSLRDEKFDGALVGEFVHALGAWPTGTWVELLDGTVGLICAQQAGAPLRPQIVVALDARREMVPVPRVVEPTGKTDIVRALPPNVAPLNVGRLEPALAPVFAG
jgi:HD-GYP domain-containing protein (c-di-GMP phosphodiesterase class II)